MNQEQFFQELRTALHREGFTPQPEQDELLPVEWDGLPLCRITADGGVRYWPEDVATPERKRACEQVTDLACTVREYRGTGIAAKLYYESKVAEALSLVVEYQKKRSVSDHKLVPQDLERIQTVAAYLSDHYAGEVPIERLAQIACMGTTKLKSSFKKVYGCTITEYIQQRRMSQAEYLLAHTDLQIGQIAQTIGYSTSSRFAELFRRSTGLLPLEYRKIAKRK